MNLTSKIKFFQKMISDRGGNEMLGSDIGEQKLFHKDLKKKYTTLSLKKFLYQSEIQS